MMKVDVFMFYLFMRIGFDLWVKKILWRRK